MSVYLPVLRNTVSLAVGVRIRSLHVYCSKEVEILMGIKKDQTHFRGLARTAFKPILVGQLVLLLSVGWGDPLRVSQGDRAFAQSDSDSVIDRIPEATTEVLTDQGNNLFLPQILYAGIIVWIISLMGSGRD